MTEEAPVPPKAMGKDNRQPVLVTILVLMTLMTLILYWKEGIDSHSPEAQTNAQADVAAAQNTVNSVKRRIEADRESEGFFRRHFWFDSDQLKADRNTLQHVEYQLALAQAALCHAQNQKNCPIPDIYQGHPFERLLHYFKIALLVVGGLWVVGMFSDSGSSGTLRGWQKSSLRSYDPPDT